MTELKKMCSKLFEMVHSCSRRQVGAGSDLSGTSKMVHLTNRSLPPIYWEGMEKVAKGKVAKGKG